jgi:hypothetical protein
MTVLRIAMVCGLALASFSARADGKSELQAAPTVQIDRTVVDATGKIVGYLIAGPPSDYSNNPSLIVVHGTGANAAASASARISAPGFIVDNGTVQNRYYTLPNCSGKSYMGASAMPPIADVFGRGDPNTGGSGTVVIHMPGLPRQFITPTSVYVPIPYPDTPRCRNVTSYGPVFVGPEIQVPMSFTPPFRLQ